MKPTNEPRTLVTSSTESTAFRVSEKNAGKIMQMLADGIYTDRILAVLREYSANAWDAHRMAGKSDMPIEVWVPTRELPFLKIRDRGPGLSHEDMFEIFCSYGESTKEDTNDAVGMLGIGSKSGFAYSDTFTVISYHGGSCRTYVAAKDDDDNSKLMLMSEEPSDETGLEIQIAAKMEDLYEFSTTASRLFRHFSPRPTININLPAEPDEQTVLQNGTITGSGGTWIAVMGCVPYRVDIQKLDAGKISRCLPNLSGSLFFDIGDVQISTSREELRYSTLTKDKLVTKFNDLVDEYVIHALEDLDRPEVTAWDKRLKVQVLAALDLPLPEEYQELAMMHAKITYAPGSFTLLHNTSVTTRITVTDRTRLLMDDTGNALTGYRLGHDDYIVRCADGASIADTRILLEAALAASGLTGATIELLSTLYWSAPYVKPKKVTNPKHKSRMFTLDPSGSYHAPFSAYWEIVERVPEDSDVHLVIEGFCGYDGFFREYRADAELAEYFGVTMPVIYGYKTSDRKPVLSAQLKGTEYRVWRETMIKGLLTDANIARVQEYFWHAPSDKFSSWPSDACRDRLIEELGADHPICVLLARQDSSKETSGFVGKLATLAKISVDTSEAGKAFAAIEERYPLLAGSLNNLWTQGYSGYSYAPHDREAWVDYVRLVDERAARTSQMHLSAPGLLSAVA